MLLFDGSLMCIWFYSCAKKSILALYFPLAFCEQAFVQPGPASFPAVAEPAPGSQPKQAVTATLNAGIENTSVYI